MNGYCHTLGCFFGAVRNSDCDSDGWAAVQVYRDGNPIVFGHADTEEEAEDIAGAECERQLQDNSQFGAGA